MPYRASRVRTRDRVIRGANLPRVCRIAYIGVVDRKLCKLQGLRGDLANVVILLVRFSLDDIDFGRAADLVDAVGEKTRGS